MIEKQFISGGYYQYFLKYNTCTEMVRLNVCLTGVEGRELWFSRGIEEILNTDRRLL
jgi:hypothetical protein